MKRVSFPWWLSPAATLLMLCVIIGCSRSSGPRFEISFPASIHKEAITGRVFLIVTKHDDMEPRFQFGSWGAQNLERRNPFFGIDVDQVKPDQAMIVDATTGGYPLKSIKEIPPGDYYVQGLLNIYTQFNRADGHTIWAHMDEWEGQRMQRSPGNLYSDVQKVHFDPDSNGTIKITLARVIPPVQVPLEDQWVKRIKLQSQILTKFWGQPIYLGATILLPKGYDDHPKVYYPVLYEQGHFGLNPPFRFNTQEVKETDEQRDRRLANGGETGYEVYQSWISEGFPRMLVVTFQHPTPYFDDSYAVNSANNGPFGDAIMTELIPYVEEHFRIIRSPYARVLSGGSTGGWESLALQVLHPEFFGGTWTMFPDCIDFRHYSMSDIYKDENAFFPPGYEWSAPERPWQRNPDGQVQFTMREWSQLEATLGTHGRSTQQLDIWQAVYGPVGPDGYPKDLWDKKTGKIDHEVANYMRDHKYDLTYYIKTNWDKIGPLLKGKLHLYVGDMDHFYLNLGVYELEDFLKTAQPPYEGEFHYGRPLKGHGWRGITNVQLLKAMAEHITKHAPAGEQSLAWKYR
jgi:hypothetical protein